MRLAVSFCGFASHPTEHVVTFYLAQCATPATETPAPHPPPPAADRTQTVTPQSRLPHHVGHPSVRRLCVCGQHTAAGDDLTCGSSTLPVPCSTWLLIVSPQALEPRPQDRALYCPVSASGTSAGAAKGVSACTQSSYQRPTPHHTDRTTSSSALVSARRACFRSTFPRSVDKNSASASAAFSSRLTAESTCKTPQTQQRPCIVNTDAHGR